MLTLRSRSLLHMALEEEPRPLADSKAEHKIQSGHGTLSLEMDQVPKVLRPLVQEWIPEGYVVSFKVSPLSAYVLCQMRRERCLLGDSQMLIAGPAASQRRPSVGDWC